MPELARPIGIGFAARGKVSDFESGQTLFFIFSFLTVYAVGQILGENS